MTSLDRFAQRYPFPLDDYQVTAIQAILNGTSNFILTSMAERGVSYATALAEAQALGYAETDPTLDVDGSDFPTHATQMAARLPEAHHDDLKRLWLQQPVKIWTGDAILEMERPERSDRHVPAMAWPRPPVRQHRDALPRAALVDVPPSA